MFLNINSKKEADSGKAHRHFNILKSTHGSKKRKKLAFKLIDDGPPKDIFESEGYAFIPFFDKEIKDIETPEDIPEFSVYENESVINMYADSKSGKARSPTQVKSMHHHREMPDLSLSSIKSAPRAPRLKDPFVDKMKVFFKNPNVEVSDTEDFFSDTSIPSDDEVNFRDSVDTVSLSDSERVPSVNEMNFKPKVTFTPQITITPPERPKAPNNTHLNERKDSKDMENIAAALSTYRRETDALFNPKRQSTKSIASSSRFSNISSLMRDFEDELSFLFPKEESHNQKVDSSDLNNDQDLFDVVAPPPIYGE
jgi:hypothetical protein